MRRKFTVQDAKAHAPLVRAILRDITSAHADVWKYRRRLDLLHECRHSQRYDVRMQYYETLTKASKAEDLLSRMSEELGDLGVTLLDPVRGLAGFPFRLAEKSAMGKPRRAYFLLKLSSEPNEELRTWQKAGETHERPIPEVWQESEVAVAPKEIDSSIV